jgi:hypothetical protein
MMVIGLMASQLGCASGTDRLVRTAVPAGIEATLQSLDNPENQEILLRLLGDPELRDATQELVAAVTRGAVDGATDAEQARELEALSESYVRTMSATLAEVLDEEISPAATRSVQRIVGGAITSAVGADKTRLTSSYVDGVTRTAVVALMQSTAAGLEDDIGPALGAVIRDDLGPALHAMIRDDLKPALGELLDAKANEAIGSLVRQITKDAVLGANDGMSELGMSMSPNEEDGLGLFGWLTVALGFVVALLLLWLVRTIVRQRRLEQERLRLEQDRARSEEDRARSEADRARSEEDRARSEEERARSERRLLAILKTLQSTEDPSHAPDLDTLIARARMSDDPDPTHEVWWNDILTRARVNKDVSQPIVSPATTPPPASPGALPPAA